jgi:hypothetical protein
MRLAVDGRVAALTEPIGACLAALPVLVGRWRELTFDGDGVVNHGDVRREGLRVERGSHPHAGTGYRLVTVTGGEDNTEYSVDLLADDHRALGFRVTRQDFPAVSIEVRVVSPAAPSRLTVVWTNETDAPWPASGLLDGEVSVALNHLPPRRTTGPQLLVTIRHPRLRGQARVLITPGEDGTWRLRAKIRFRGRWIWRPLGAIAVPFLRKPATQGLADLMEQLSQFCQEFVEHFRGLPATPEQLATAIFDEFLTMIER